MLQVLEPAAIAVRASDSFYSLDSYNSCSEKKTFRAIRVICGQEKKKTFRDIRAIRGRKIGLGKSDDFLDMI